MYPTQLPICPQPMFAVMVINLRSHRHICVLRKIRRTDCRKLRKQRYIIVWMVPKSHKLVIINVKMNAFAGFVFCCFGKIEWNPLDFIDINCFRLDLGNLIFPNPMKYDFIAIFEVKNILPPLFYWYFSRLPRRGEAYTRCFRASCGFLSGCPRACLPSCGWGILPVPME